MGTYSQEAGGTRRVWLEIPVRAWWSRPRAWHGDALVLHVETAYVPDHTQVTLRIYEANVSPLDEDTFIHETSGLELVGNRLAAPYTLAWDQKALGRPLGLQGERCEFFFEVRIDRPQVRARSNLLYVHLHRHVVSG
jgi:hypothetical protein